MTQQHIATGGPSWVIFHEGDVAHHVALLEGQQVESRLANIEVFDDEGTADARMRQLDPLWGVDPDDESFVPPFTLDEAFGQLAAMRYAREIGGLTLRDGTGVRTTRESQAQLMNAVSSYGLGLASGAVNWKLATGWVMLGADDLRAMAAVVTRHVQACFAAEKYVSDVLSNEPRYWTMNAGSLFERAYLRKMGGV